MSEIAKHEFPSEWPSFFSDMLAQVLRGPSLLADGAMQALAADPESFLDDTLLPALHASLGLALPRVFADAAHPLHTRIRAITVAIAALRTAAMVGDAPVHPQALTPGSAPSGPPVSALHLADAYARPWLEMAPHVRSRAPAAAASDTAPDARTAHLSVPLLPWQVLARPPDSPAHALLQSHVVSLLVRVATHFPQLLAARPAAGAAAAATPAPGAAALQSALQLLSAYLPVYTRAAGASPRARALV